MKDSHKDLDVIVVGSGPGGATVARELSLKGKRVLIIERGDGKPRPAASCMAQRTFSFPARACTLLHNFWGGTGHYRRRQHGFLLCHMGSGTLFWN